MPPWPLLNLAVLEAILGKLETLLANQKLILSKENAMAIDLTKMQAQDASLIQEVGALGPLIQTAITDISGITTSDPTVQAAIDAHVAALQPVADTLTQLGANLAAAEAPPAPAPTPAPTPAPATPPPTTPAV